MEKTKHKTMFVLQQCRRSWLRGAALKAASVAMLFFMLTGCTKEQWNNVVRKAPGRGVGAAPDQWYILQVTYYPYPGGGIAEKDWLGHQDEYVKVGGRDKFKMYQGANGFNYLKFEDGTWLSLSYGGWAYRSSEDDRVGWKIIDGNLYPDYERWKDYPLGCQEKPDLFGFKYFYVGVGFEGGTTGPRSYWLFDCTYVPVP